MKDSLIKVRGLTKYFQSTQSRSYALHQVQLDIYQGDIYGIIGASGAGKSTLLRCLTALERPDDGSIVIHGEELTAKTEKELSCIRHQIGMIFQHFYLFSSRTVAKNIAYPLEIQGFPKDQQEKRVEELLLLVGLEGKKEFYPSQLSGGEKQRVGIARALAHKPDLLFCDEPTSALDSKTARSILQLLLKLNRELGLTIVMITHQLEAVKQICNRVAVLSKGEVVEEGDVKQIFIRPEHVITRHLLHLETNQLPADLLVPRDQTKKLIRLGFEGHQAKEPIISHLIKQHEIEANILSGSLDYLQSTLIGNLVIELTGSPAEIQRALQYLHHQHIHYEVLA